MTEILQQPPDQKTKAVQRADAFARLFRIFTIFALGVCLVCLLLGVQSGAWQVFVVAFSPLIALIPAYYSNIFSAGRRKLAALLLASMSYLVAYALPTLFLSNASLYFLVGGALLILIAGALLFATWRHRLLILGIFIAGTLVLSQVGLFPRYDIQSLPAFRFLLPGITIAICITAFWQFVRTFRFNTIRARLLLSFISIVIIPLVIAAGVASTIGSQATVKSAADLLTAVSVLKEDSLNSWVLGLQDGLHMETLRDQEMEPIATLLGAEPGSVEYRINYRNMQYRFNTTISMWRQFDELLLLDPNGKVVLATYPGHEGQDFSGEAFFQQGSKRQSFQPPAQFKSFGQPGVVVSEPVIDLERNPMGVLVGFSSLAKANGIMQGDVGVGETGETYLVGPDYSLLTPVRLPDYQPWETRVLTKAALAAVMGKQSGTSTYDNYAGTTVIGVYKWLPELNLAIVAEQNREEVFLPTRATIIINSAISIILILCAVVFAVKVTNSIALPISDLTDTAQRIADGELDLTATVNPRTNEVALLAMSFNRMTDQLKKLIAGLEQIVKVRTKELETRTEQLEAASKVSSAATTILEPRQLILQVVNVIQELFGLYYVGLFLTDDAREYAVLQAGTGEAGQNMVARGHRIQIGQGMIGWSILNNQARISHKVAEDEVRLSTPDLPETQSEAAIPLRSRGQVLGAITIQSQQANAFDEATVATFQTIADQVAIAIDNARLFDETQRALETTRRAYGELSRQDWQERLTARALHVRRTPQGLSMTETVSPNENYPAIPDREDSDGILDIPITVRGNVIGSLHAEKPPDRSTWSDDEREILATLSEQLGVALESARLFEDTLLRAENERLIGDVTNRVRETLDIDTVLKTAATELQGALDLEEVEVRMYRA